MFQEGRVGQLCWLLLRVIFPRKPVSVTLLITTPTSASKKSLRSLSWNPRPLTCFRQSTCPDSSPWLPPTDDVCAVALWTLTSVYHLLLPHSSPHIAAFVWRCAPLPPFQSTWFWVTSAARGMGHTIRSMLIKCFTLSWQDWWGEGTGEVI